MGAAASFRSPRILVVECLSGLVDTFGDCADCVQP